MIMENIMEKWIQTRGTEWRCAIISGHYCKSLDVFCDLFSEAEKDFDFLTYYNVECLEVVNSIRCKGNSMLCFSIPANSPIPDGWLAKDDVDELRR